MECHGDRLPGRYISTGAKDTMSATVKPAKEFHETDVGQVIVCPSTRTLDTKRPAPTREGWSRRHRGACNGDEVRHGVPIDVFPRQAAESNALLFSLDQPLAGYMVKSMRLIPTNKVGQACDRVGLQWLPREACYDQERGQSKVEKDTVTLNEEPGEVLPWRRTKRRTGVVWHAERRCRWRCPHGAARDELHAQRRKG